MAKEICYANRILLPENARLVLRILAKTVGRKDDTYEEAIIGSSALFYDGVLYAADSCVCGRH